MLRQGNPKPAEGVRRKSISLAVLTKENRSREFPLDLEGVVRRKIFTPRSIWDVCTQERKGGQHNDEPKYPRKETFLPFMPEVDGGRDNVPRKS